MFPWVLSDYDSEILDLNNIEIYRDLSKPMGAQTDQTEPRASEFKERYDTYEDSSGEVSKFHYGTRYSCGGIICYFLIRLESFTRIALNYFVLLFVLFICVVYNQFNFDLCCLSILNVYVSLIF